MMIVEHGCSPSRVPSADSACLMMGKNCLKNGLAWGGMVKLLLVGQGLNSPLIKLGNLKVGDPDCN